MTPVRHDRGSVLVVVTAMVMVLFLGTLGLADLATVASARVRAQAAADAAALGAAAEIALPKGTLPWQVAEEYAARNGADLTACACEIGTTEAEVEVRVDAQHLRLIPGPVVVTAAARAVVSPPPRPPSPTPPGVAG